MKDHLVRATTNGIRAFCAVTTSLVEEARLRHDCLPVATAALGRTLTGSLLLAANLKTSESITIRISGNGPLGNIVTDAQADGTVRGYVENPQIDLPLKNGKLDVGTAVGEGYIYVTRFTGLKQPFTGSCSLVSGEIAEDITNYLFVSEQTPSSVALGVLVNPDYSVAYSGGFFIQVLPGVEDEIIKQVETNVATLPTITNMLNSGLDATGIVQRILSGMPITFYEQTQLTFKCSCSIEKVANMLISLGQSELTELVNEGQAEVYCHYCNERYVFNQNELSLLCTKCK